MAEDTLANRRDYRRENSISSHQGGGGGGGGGGVGGGGGGGGWGGVLGRVSDGSILLEAGG